MHLNPQVAHLIRSRWGGSEHDNAPTVPSAVGLGSEGALSNFTSSAASGAVSGVKVKLTQKFHTDERKMKYKHDIMTPFDSIRHIF